MTLVFGVLSLVVAVTVDTFAEAREKDVTTRAADMEQQEREEKKVLAKLFERIDGDNSGVLTFSELEAAARRVEGFRHWLRVLDIDMNDLQQLFSFVDEDDNGEINPQEFIDVMYRMKNADPKTTTLFLKKMVMRMERDTLRFKREIASSLRTLQSAVGQQIQGLATGMEMTVERSLVRGLSQQRGALPSADDSALRSRLSTEGSEVQEALQSALGKAMEVALEAAISSATEQVQEVISAALAEDIGRASIARSASKASSRPLGGPAARPPATPRVAALEPPVPPPALVVPPTATAHGPRLRGARLLAPPQPMSSVGGFDLGTEIDA